ncbi:MAG: glycoside hydrolase, partial [Bacteroidales bacterium]|nr:glycoside hydrolase [Bacteroidales bacterium]
MTYFNQFKNATRKTKRLLVLFALLFGFSAHAATHVVSATPVDPSTLDDGAQVVMYHNGTGKLVGCQDGKEVTKGSKEITDADWTFHQYVLDDGTGGHGTAPTKHGQLTAWDDNAGYQEVGYIGLGNKNQVLASACVNITNGNIPTIAYRLFGKTNFLSAVSVYARKRDKDQDYNSDKTAYGSFENTFAHMFDYRNPEKNCGAIFLGFTYDVPEQYEPASFTSNVKLDAGEYVIYLVANTKTAEEIGGLDQLPLIGGSRNNFTRVGGVIETVTCGTTTYKINTVNNYSKDGGGRVLVPKFKLLYAPRYEKFATSEEYSRYYRIPAITRASDGTLVALSDARKMHIHDVTNSIDVVSR